MVSIFTVKAVIEVGSYDLARYLSEKYEVDFEFESQGNDTTQKFTVHANGLDNWDRDRLEKILKRGWVDQGYLRILMTDAAIKGWIVEGEYIVDFSW